MKNSFAFYKGSSGLTEFYKKTLLLFVVITVLTGCSRTDTPTPRETKNHAGNVQEKKLTIGLIPEQNIFKQFERYRPLSEYIYKKTGVKIELRVLPRYGNIINNFRQDNLDGAFWGSFTYALARSRFDLEPIARPESLDGTSTYHGLILVRKDSGIKNAKDMKNKRFAFVDKATTAGYLLPLAYFKKNDIINYRTYLKEIYFTGTHEDTIYDVLNKKADIGAAKNTVFDRLAQSDNRIRRELSILSISPDVPENCLALKMTVDVMVRKKIKDVLLQMERDAEGAMVLKSFGAKRFIVTKDKDYAPVFKYASDIGLNLAAYDYLNN